jgi:hypothetical protein
MKRVSNLLWRHYLHGGFRLQRVAGGWKLSRLSGISVWDKSLIGTVRRWRRVNG